MNKFIRNKWKKQKCNECKGNCFDKLRWSKLSCPLRYTAPIAAISNTEFVLAHHHEDFSGICTCNSASNQWTKAEINYPDDFSLGIHSIAFNPISNTIYISTQKQLLSINMKSKNCTILSTYNNIFEQVPQIFYISNKNEIHLINFTTHYVVNLNHKQRMYEQRMRKLYDFTKLYLDPGSMIFIASKQCIIGRSFKLFDDVVNNSISEYSLINNKWKHFNEWIPLSLISRVGVTTITKHQDYILSIVAKDKDDLSYGCHMLIYDVNKNEFKRGMKIPSKELSFITITNDENKDRLITHGFVTNKYMPCHLIDYIQNWICSETVHCIADNKRNNYTNAEYWNINVDQIIQSATKITLMQTCS